jgi:hypothetical protein
MQFKNWQTMKKDQALALWSKRIDSLDRVISMMQDKPGQDTRMLEMWHRHRRSLTRQINYINNGIVVQNKE